jgi:hypothetical protein
MGRGEDLDVLRRAPFTDHDVRWLVVRTPSVGSTTARYRPSLRLASITFGRDPHEQEIGTTGADEKGWKDATSRCSRTWKSGRRQSLWVATTRRPMLPRNLVELGLTLYCGCFASAYVRFLGRHGIGASSAPANETTAYGSGGTGTLRSRVPIRRTRGPRIHTHRRDPTTDHVGDRFHGGRPGGEPDDLVSRVGHVCLETPDIVNSHGACPERTTHILAFRHWSQKKSGQHETCISWPVDLSWTGREPRGIGTS